MAKTPAQVSADYRANHPERVAAARKRAWKETVSDPKKYAKVQRQKKAWRKKHREELAAKQRDYCKNNPEKSRWSSRGSVHKMTLDEYKALLAEQSGVCAICKEVEIVKGKSLAIDHNHKTMQRRGLLCGRCNKALGLLRESPAIIKSVLEYLQKWGVVVNPPEELHEPAPR